MKTPEQKAETTGRDGRRRRRGKTPDAKRRPSLNATRTALRARTFPLPNEDQEAVRQRAEIWHNHYNPQSPAAIHLTNECARATLLADRCDRYRQAALVRQQRETKQKWRRRRQAHA